MPRTPKVKRATCPHCKRVMPKPKPSKVDLVWPSTAFWRAAYTVLALTSDEWGTPLARDVTNREWTPGRLVIRSGGHEQCGYAWDTRAA